MKALVARIAAHIPSMHGWCSLEKANEMAKLIVETKPDVVVEIGVWGGRSLMPQAFACQHIRHGKVHGIDPWSAEAALKDVQEKANLDWWAKVDYEEMYKYTLRQIIEHDATSVCNLFRTTSEKASFLFDHVDILHIDGNHSEAVSTQDVFLWLPKVKSGGYVWLDDIGAFATANAERLLDERCERIMSLGNEGEARCALFRKK